MSSASTQRLPLLERFAERERELATSGPEWLRELRREGRSRFESLGLPTVRQEAWRNTNLAPLSRIAFGPGETHAEARVTGLPPAAELSLSPLSLTFVDGRLAVQPAPGDAPASGVYVGSLATLLEREPERIRQHLRLGHEDPTPEFQLLNSAFLEDGAVVLVPPGVVLEHPVQIVYLSGTGTAETASHPRTLIVAGESSQVQVVEIHAGPADRVYFTNTVNHTVLGDNAVLDHVRVQLESEQAYHVSTAFSRQGRDSRLRAFNFDLGGKLVRHNLRAVLAGEGAECTLLGLYLTRGKQHVDNHTTLDHAQPRCRSRELYKGILDGESRSVFSGRIVVRQDAQKTDAKQSNPNLLLSDKALVRTRPQLEIYADDVRCTHGATVGQIDADSIFYLRSRGISEKDAVNMLVNAFAGEVLEQIALTPLREALEREVARRLPRV